MSVIANSFSKGIKRERERAKEDKIKNGKTHSLTKVGHKVQHPNDSNNNNFRTASYPADLTFCLVFRGSPAAAASLLSAP